MVVAVSKKKEELRKPFTKLKGLSAKETKALTSAMSGTVKSAASSLCSNGNDLYLRTVTWTDLRGKAKEDGWQFMPTKGVLNDLQSMSTSVWVRPGERACIYHQTVLLQIE